MERGKDKQSQKAAGGQVASPTLFDSLYTYAWFVTFGLSFVLYLASSRRSRI